MPVNTPIFEPGVVPKYAYFMTSGIASVVADMEGGSAVEVGSTRTGGAAGQHSSTRRPDRGYALLHTVGWYRVAIGFHQLAKEFHTNRELHARILQHVQCESLLSSQLSACNRLHDVEERLARWLLMVSDRLESEELTITQEFLGQMLGTRRSSVTVSAGTLQRAGLIDYHRGYVRIWTVTAWKTLRASAIPPSTA